MLYFYYINLVIKLNGVRSVGDNSKESLNSILVGPIGILDIPVYTTDTITFGDLDADKSTIAPPATPGVLNLPVVAFAVNKQLTTAVCLFSAAVPPFINIAGCRCGLGVGSGLGIGSGVWIDFTAFIAVANDGDGVIETSRTAIACPDDTTAVVLEDTVTSRYGNINGLHSDDPLHLIEIGIDASIIGNISKSIRALGVIARAELLSDVWVVTLQGGAFTDQIVVVILHPASFATPASPVITVVATTTIVSECAVNTLLFGDTGNVLVVGLGAEGALKRGRNSEGPA